MINTDKLNALRDQHQRRRDVYAGVNERARAARVAAAEACSFHPSITATPAQKEMAGRVLALPPAEMMALPPEVLSTIGVTPAMINKAIETKRRADSLQKESEALLAELHAGGAVLAKLNDWARGQT